VGDSQMIIYIVRHGDYSHSGGDLTALGIKQAIEVGKHIVRDTRKYLILTSPIKRAKQTAEYINQTLMAKDFIVVDSLREIEKGETEEELKERAWISFLLASGFEKYDVVLVSHRALIQAMLSNISKKESKVFIVEKGDIYYVNIKSEITINHFSVGRIDIR
jgi:broad specificity phosphatase PhoE